MAQLGGFFTTAATAEGDDEQVSYTQAHWYYATSILAACSGYEGVAPGFLNELSATATAVNEVTVDTGGAVVDGRWYYNTEAATVAVDSAAAGNTRIDRIVVRCDTTNMNISIHNVTGTDSVGTPTAPTVESTSGTTYDILLWQALVDDGGNITLTDERVWAAATNNGIRSSAGMSVLGRAANTTGKIADITAANAGYVLMCATAGTSIAFGQIKTESVATDAITIAKIPDRTRKVLIAMRQDSAIMADGADTTLASAWRVPEDFYSNMTIKFVCIPSGTGNLYGTLSGYYGAAGEVLATHSYTSGLIAEAVTNGQYCETHSASLANVAVNDNITLGFGRTATNALDTVNAAVTAMGWLISYTADS